MNTIEHFREHREIKQDNVLRTNPNAIFKFTSFLKWNTLRFLYKGPSFMLLKWRLFMSQKYKIQTRLIQKSSAAGSSMGQRWS
jgi:hypothetical protein